MNIRQVVDSNLCCGCSTCVAICPRGSITLKVKKDIYVPEVTAQTCIETNGCGLCYDVCPGIEIKINRLSNNLFKEGIVDVDLGRYVKCFSGYSMDPGIRFNSASGGVVTQLLIYLLENNSIKGAIVTRMSKEDPLLPEVVVASTVEEIIQAKSSKYCPVPTNILLKNILLREGNFAFVGLPCHIHGLRKAQEKFPKLRDKINFVFGLYCSSTHNFGAMEFLLKKVFKIKKESVKSFIFRGEGCLGNMVVNYGQDLIKREAFVKYHAFLRSFFIPFRCTLCIDHAAELADISFGDIYIPEFWEDKIGTTSIILRNPEKFDFLAKAKEAGVISLDDLDANLIKKSQKDSLKRKKITILLAINLINWWVGMFHFMILKMQLM